MLVIGRRSGERFVIDNNDTGERIMITLLKSSGAQVKIGIDADKKYSVVREELLNESPLQNKKAPPSNPW